MSEWTWVLNDANGNAIRSSEHFSSRDDAEGWMTTNWSALLDEGAETVSLMDGDRFIYRMGLREA